MTDSITTVNTITLPLSDEDAEKLAQLPDALKPEAPQDRVETAPQQ